MKNVCFYKLILLSDSTAKKTGYPARNSPFNEWMHLEKYLLGQQQPVNNMHDAIGGRDVRPDNIRWGSAVSFSRNG
jgi:hypothetical protein